MPRKIRVYVAGPYTRPDPCANTHRAVHVGQKLWDGGYAPFVPHLTHFWHTMIPNPYESWLAFDIEWLHACDVMLRLDGESSGADKEEEEAKKSGIPVVRSLKELRERFPIAA
jgi:hypothetical protein